MVNWRTILFTVYSVLFTLFWLEYLDYFHLVYNRLMVSIFTKIIQGDIPSYRVYEDAHIYAFLSIEPFHLGHTLVVPKQEI